MSDTTRLQLPLLAAAQAQKHVTHNEAILRLDGLVQMTAKSYTTSAEPSSPSDGDLYLLPAGKTGSDWGGYSNHAVAHYYDGIWHQYHPNAGWLCFVQDTTTLLYYTGSTWANVGAVVSNLFGDGSVSAPSVGFSADTDTGLYRIGSNNAALSAGGTKVVDMKASGVAVLGSNTNDNAASGFVGELLSASAANNAVSLTNDVAANAVSLSLTAGDWDVSGVVLFQTAGSTTVTQFVAAISTVSATFPGSTSGGT